MSDPSDFFALDPAIHYLNHAYLAPQLKSSIAAAQQQLAHMGNPHQMDASIFFDPANKVRSRFAHIIGSKEPDRVALIPSASYGLANAARQVRPVKGSNLVLLQGQFPSNVYIWQRVARDFECELRWVEAPEFGPQMGEKWNQALLAAVDSKTAVVAVPPLFWSDGIRFDLVALRQRTKEVGAYFVLDGSQALGALPIDVDQLQPDALVSAAYKFLCGPYGTALAWYGPNYDGAEPMEDNWLAHEGASDFQNLVKYNPNYAAVGQRFSSGQHPAFLQLSMLNEALKQVGVWGAAKVQAHATTLLEPFIEKFMAIGCGLLPTDQRCAHLFGLRLPKGVSLSQVKKQLEAKGVFVSLRGDSMRVSLYLYNQPQDLQALLSCLKSTL
ncbi:MAG: aminotransferase class V-fold PLP-dependent enzyme [Salibacteraceae bacterium]